MSMEVSTYMLASGLIAGGMDWKQALGTILLGNLIVLIPLLSERACGREVRDSVPGVRAGIVWDARREYSGDSARDCGVRMVWHSVVDRRAGDPRDARCDLAGVEAAPWSVWACFLGFWALNMVVVWRGVESIRFLQGFSAPFMLIMSLAAAVLRAAQGGRALGPCFRSRAISIPRARS